jgi:hypothetical protein
VAAADVASTIWTSSAFIVGVIVGTILGFLLLRHRREIHVGMHLDIIDSTRANGHEVATEETDQG